MPLRKNFLAGLLFAGLGLLGFWLARHLEVGSAEAMQAGYFPRMVCGALAACGGALSLVALIRPDEPAQGWHWRPLIFVTLSAVAFALLLRPLGLVITLAVTILLASLSAPMLPPIRLALFTLVLIVINVGLFVLALNMPIPLWPALR